MVVLPPGTLLQLMYLRERIHQITPGRFIEIGPGSGEIMRLLLNYGWSGYSYDLDAITIDFLKDRFSKEIAEHRFTPINEDYLLYSFPRSEKVDLIISSMVMEHLENEAQFVFMNRSANHLNEKGIMIGIVPASPSHWGIEDDIAGHCRRYTRAFIKTLVTKSGWELRQIAGLTFPISNLLLPASNFLVTRSEKSKLALAPLDRTKLSSRRQVKFKTHFPYILQILLNKLTFYPLYLVQKLFVKSERALVLYFEAKPNLGINRK